MKTRLLVTVAAFCALALLPACNSTDLATFQAGAKADLASQAGKQLAASVFQDALTITLAAISKGTDVAADKAAADSLGGTMEAISALPTSTGEFKTLTATAASTSTTVAKATPQIVDLVTTAQKKGLTYTQAVQTAAAGVYAATGFNPLQATAAAVATAP